MYQSIMHGPAIEPSLASHTLTLRSVPSTHSYHRTTTQCASELAQRPAIGASRLASIDALDGRSYARSRRPHPTNNLE